MFKFLKKKQPKYPEEMRTYCGGLETQSDGWVVFETRLTTAEIEKIVKAANLRIPKLKGANGIQIVTVAMENLDGLARLMSPLILDWNWKERGQTLPLISQKPEVIAQLDIRELSWLVWQIWALIGEAKRLKRR